MPVDETRCSFLPSENVYYNHSLQNRQRNKNLFIFADLLLHVSTFILRELKLFGCPVVSQYSASLSISISFKYMF
jgi:lipid A disaccharide synthetase